MFKPFFPYFTVTLLAILFSPFVHSAPIVVHVHNQHGEQLKNAIIEIIDPSAEQNTVPTEPAVMDQVNKRFVPDLIVIQQGQSVLFPNSDDIRHHVYSFSQAKQFELKLYAGKPKAAIPFEKNGVVIVGCNIHDSMVGSIYVAKNRTQKTSDDGTATLELTSTSEQISVWHSNQQAAPEQRVIFDINKLKSNEYMITIPTIQPPARDTFGDTFGDYSAE